MQKLLGAGLTPALAALVLAGCATTHDTAQTGQPSFDHARAYGLPQNMIDQAQTMLAEMEPSVPANVSLSLERAKRADIAATASRRTSAHETSLEAGKIASFGSENRFEQGFQNIVESLGGGWSRGSEGFFHTLSGLRCSDRHQISLVDEKGEKTIQIIPLVNIRLYDDAGLDTACDYENRQEQLFLTVYVSKWPDISLNDHYAEALKLIVDRLPVESESTLMTLQLKSEEAGHASTIEGQTKAAAYILSPSEGVQLKTILLLNKTGDWHVKVRGTFPVKVVEGQEELAPMELMTNITHILALMEVDKHINTGMLTQVSY